MVHDDDRPLNRVGDVHHDGRESRLVLRGHRVGGGGECRPGVEDQQGGAEVSALGDEAGHVSGIEQVKPRPDEKVQHPRPRPRRPGRQDVVAAALQPGAAILPRDVHDHGSLPDREVTGHVAPPAGDREAAVHAKEALVALGGAAPPDDALLRDERVDREGGRGERPRVGRIVEPPRRHGALGRLSDAGQVDRHATRPSITARNARQSRCPQWACRHVKSKAPEA